MPTAIRHNASGRRRGSASISHKRLLTHRIVSHTLAMTATDATQAPTSADPGQHLSAAETVRRWLVPPGVALLSIVALFFVYLFTSPDDPPMTAKAFVGEVLTLFAMLAPTTAVVLAVAVLVVLTGRFLRRGLPVAAVMSVLVSAAVVYGMVVMMFDDSSTGALLFLLLPIELGLVLVPFVVGILLAHWLRGREHRTHAD